MKKAFIIVCDAMVVAVCVGLGAAVAWIILGIFGRDSAATAALSTAGVAAVTAAILFAASFVVWKCGGAPEGVMEPYDDDFEEDIDNTSTTANSGNEKGGRTK